MRLVVPVCCATILFIGGCAQHPEKPANIEQSREEAAVKLRDVPLHAELAAYINDTLTEFDQIPQERRKKLRELAGFVANRANSGQSAELVFICTHNSRRSHMSQLWAQTAAHSFGVNGVRTYSGGTEATAFNPRAVAAVERAGFAVEKTSEGDNPVYAVSFADGEASMECFSKVYDQAPNPKEGFAAVMTCSAADEACPIVFGAAERIAIPFDDPKAFDGTDQETAKYDERCRQIAREMLYVFSQV
jgi:protein-tyrosine-phosphatase